MMREMMAQNGCNNHEEMMKKGGPCGMMKKMMAQNGINHEEMMKTVMKNGGPMGMMQKMMYQNGCNTHEEMMQKVMENGGPMAMMRQFMEQQQQEQPEQGQDAEQKRCPFKSKWKKGCKKNGRRGCPWKKRHQQKEDLEKADPAQAEAIRVAEAAEAEEQARIIAEKQRRLEEIEKKNVELAEQKFALAEMRESMKKSKQELKSLKKENKSADKKFKQIQKQSKQIKELSRATQQQCEEITHLDLAERAILKPGVGQFKTWKVKNTGNTIWDENTEAILCKGNKSLIIPGFEKVIVGAVEPNSVAYIRVMLSVPEAVGEYSVTFRLQAPVIGKFGKPLRTVVTVQEEQEFVQSPPESALSSEINMEDHKSDFNALPALIEDDQIVDDDQVIDDLAEEIVEPAFEFPEQLKSMKEFGFPEEQSKNVLIAVRGNLEQAVNMLLMA